MDTPGNFTSRRRGEYEYIVGGKGLDVPHWCLFIDWPIALRKHFRAKRACQYFRERWRIDSAIETMGTCLRETLDVHFFQAYQYNDALMSPLTADT